MKSSSARSTGLLVCVLSLLLVACGGVKNPEGWATPGLNGDRTYFFPASDRLAGVTLGADGSVTKAWQFPDKTHPEQKDAGFKASYGVSLAGDALYFGSWNGRLYSVSASDGALRWGGANIVGGGIVGEPVVSGDRVFVGTTDGQFYAFATSNGAPAPGWPSGGVKLPAAIWAAPVVSGGKVFVATMGGAIYALQQADGSMAWPEPFKIDGAIPDLALLDDGRLFVPGLNKQVFIVSTADGKAIGPGFPTDEWVWSRPAFRDGVAYFGDFSGKVYALDITASPMTAKWTATVTDKIKAAPVLVDGVLVVGTRKPSVAFIDAQTGAIQNTVVLTDAGTIRAGLVEHNGKALIATTNGKLFDADPKSKSVSPLLVVGAKP